MKKSRTRNKSVSSHSMFETAPKAALIMLLSGLFIISASTFLALKTISPVSLARPVALCALYVGAGIGGAYCSCKLSRGDAYLASFIASVILAAVIFGARAIISDESEKTSIALSLALHLIIPIAAAIGAYAANLRPPKRKRRKR